MVKSMYSGRPLFSSTLRRNVRNCARRLDGSCTRNSFSSRSGRDNRSQVLTAFKRAIHGHRRLALLAPETFDCTELDRLARRREEDSEWRAPCRLVVGPLGLLCLQPIEEPAIRHA